MNIIMIDNDQFFYENLAKYFKSNGILDITERFDDTTLASEYVKKNNKLLELIILDLEMQNINIDEIIDNLPKNCNIIAFYNTNETLNKYINNPYIQRIFQKPIAFPSLMNYINIQNDIESLENTKKNLLRLLSDIGFNINHSGTFYIVETVILSMRNKMKKLSDIYTLIAYNHNTDPRIIGWSINNAINKAFKSDDISELQKFFKTKDNKKLTAKYVVNYLMNYNINNLQ